MKAIATRHILLICLLLIGAQAVQASHFHGHDHSNTVQHVVDCNLCHQPNLDSVLLETSAPQTFGVVRSVYHATVKQFNASQRFHAYQGRAPPAFSL